MSPPDLPSPDPSRSAARPPSQPLGAAMRGIVKRFGSAAVLNGVDLDILPGEIHAVLGENGAGKSTLMHILSGSLRADSGEILLNNERVRIDSPSAARRRGVAMVHQHFALVPAFTVAENLALDSNRSGAALPLLSALRPYSARRAAAPALERARSLGWTLEPDARVASLPVGVQQRIEVVKALSTGATLLIFDEPTAVLSGEEVEELFAVLRRLRAEGCAVVLIAHKLSEILAVADRITVLRRGELAGAMPRSEADARRLASLMMGAPPGAAGRVETSSAAVSRRVPLSEPSDRRSLEARGIGVAGERGEKAVQNVTLTLRAGEILGIGGVDGNGQAELAEALVGLRRLESGEILWEQQPFRPGESPTIGYIPQDRRSAGLALTLSVEDNLMLESVNRVGFSHGPFLRTRAMRQMAARLRETFDIRTPSMSAPAASLSGGNQQKIVAARALWPEPDVIVAVNPTRGLDIGASRFLHEQLRTARSRGAAILLISADLDEIRLLSDRAAILSSGRLADLDLSETRADEIGLILGGITQEAKPIGRAGETGR